MDRKSLEKRLGKLESKMFPSWMKIGEMPNGEQKYFDLSKSLVLQYKAMKIYIPSKKATAPNKIAPTLADFNEADQRFIKDFVIAKLPWDPYIPETRRIFAMVIMGDPAIYEQPLENFIDPVKLDL